MSIKDFPRAKVIRNHNIRDSIDSLTVDEVISNLNALRAQHGADAIIEISGEDVEVEISTVREETDEEYNQRAQRHMEMKQRMEDNDRRRYLELHARFGGKLP